MKYFRTKNFVKFYDMPTYVVTLNFAIIVGGILGVFPPSLHISKTGKFAVSFSVAARLKIWRSESGRVWRHWWPSFPTSGCTRSKFTRPTKTWSLTVANCGNDGGGAYQHYGSPVTSYGWFGVLVTFSEVELHRARPVAGLVTTFGGSTIPVFIQAHSAWSSLRG